MKYTFLTIFAAYFAMATRGEMTHDEFLEQYGDNMVEVMKQYHEGTLPADVMAMIDSSVPEMEDEEDDGHRMLREDRELSSFKEKAYARIEADYPSHSTIESKGSIFGEDRELSSFKEKAYARIEAG